MKTPHSYLYAVQLPSDASAMPLSSLGLANGDTLLLRKLAAAAAPPPRATAAAHPSTTLPVANGSTAAAADSALRPAEPDHVVWLPFDLVPFTS